MQNAITTIVSNGSKWNAQEPDPIESLIERLKINTLDPFLGASLLPYSVLATKKLHIFGNFVEMSAVFRIQTNEVVVSARLFQALWDNLNSSRFQEAANAYPCFPQATLSPHLMVPNDVTLKYGVKISRRPLI